MPKIGSNKRAKLVLLVIAALLLFGGLYAQYDDEEVVPTKTFTSPSGYTVEYTDAWYIADPENPEFEANLSSEGGVGFTFATIDVSTLGANEVAMSDSSFAKLIKDSIPAGMEEEGFTNVSAVSIGHFEIYGIKRFRFLVNVDTDGEHCCLQLTFMRKQDKLYSLTIMCDRALYQGYADEFNLLQRGWRLK